MPIALDWVLDATAHMGAVLAAEGGGGGGGWTSFVPILLVILIFYFILIRPASRERKEREAKIKELKNYYYVDSKYN